MPTRLLPILTLAALLAGASAAEARMDRVVFVGDSSLLNVTLRSPRELVTDLLQRRLRIIAQPIGAPGAIMADYDRFYGFRNIGVGVTLMSQVFLPRAIVVLLGYNDWNLNAPLDDFSAAYREFLAAMPPDVPVVCITPLWNAEEGKLNSAGHRLAEYRAAIADACSAHQVVDGLTLVDAGSDTFPDGKHPSRIGNAQMATRLLPVLTPLLAPLP
ncbi:MAG: SGNH/GDSL hydrolase family protein [Deltaproteobacteria bacterium]|nr:SGNH/GDSL hydrolase family protein [Deltaproteobacteria bacterium]